MSPALFALLGAMTSGCLLAPDRPGAPDGSDGGSDALEPDAPPLACEPSEDARLTATEVLRAPSGKAMLVRGGWDHGEFRVRFHLPTIASTRFSWTCADHVVSLVQTGPIAITRVEAIAPGPTGKVLVLVTRDDGNFAVLAISAGDAGFSLDSSTITSTVGASGIEGRETSYLAYRPQSDSLWFGGGQLIARFGGAGSLEGVASVPLIEMGADPDAYHLVVPDSANEDEFALLGNVATYKASYRSFNGTIARHADAAPGPACPTLAHDSCEPAIGRPIWTGTAHTRGYLAVGARLETGTVVLLRSGAPPPATRSAVGKMAIDVAVHGRTEAIDVAVLGGDGGALVVYPDIEDLDSTVLARAPVGGAPERVVVGTFDSGAPKLLVLDETPGAPGTREHCFTYEAGPGGGSLQACAQ